MVTGTVLEVNGGETLVNSVDCQSASHPIQGGDSERCGVWSARWTSTLGPSTVQFYVADSARRCDPDEVAAGGLHEIRAASWAIITPFAKNTRRHSRWIRTDPKGLSVVP